uniref:Uncharacterized protein n=1 Tax=Aegilops tauschii subsp. strangulata TaxID=200361 RepID=A0A453CAN7_AEGTS
NALPDYHNHSNNTTTTPPKASYHGDSSLANHRSDGTIVGPAGRALLGARGPPPRTNSSTKPRSPSWPFCPSAEPSSPSRSGVGACSRSWAAPPSSPCSGPITDPPPPSPRSSAVPGAPRRRRGGHLE